MAHSATINGAIARKMTFCLNFTLCFAEMIDLWNSEFYVRSGAPAYVVLRSGGA
jgi:hypothetical protein